MFLKLSKISFEIDRWLSLLSSVKTMLVFLNSQIPQGRDLPALTQAASFLIAQLT